MATIQIGNIQHIQDDFQLLHDSPEDTAHDDIQLLFSKDHHCFFLYMYSFSLQDDFQMCIPVYFTPLWTLNNFNPWHSDDTVEDEDVKWFHRLFEHNPEEFDAIRNCMAQTLVHTYNLGGVQHYQPLLDLLQNKKMEEKKMDEESVGELLKNATFTEEQQLEIIARARKEKASVVNKD
jgi:hypothetical protein